MGEKLECNADATGEQKVNVAVSSVYSLGGQNAALVFKNIAEG